MQEELEWKDYSTSGILESEVLYQKGPEFNQGVGMVAKCFGVDSSKYFGANWIDNPSIVYYADTKDEIKLLIYTMVRMG